jgi:hypothetical protein
VSGEIRIAVTNEMYGCCMKKMLPSILIVLWLSAALPGFGAQGKFVPFEEEGKWGYKDEKGKVMINPQYSVAGAFSPEGIAAVVDHAGWAYINRKGEVVIRPFIVDNGPDYFQEGVARFIEKGKFGFFDRTGKVIIQPQFDFVGSFHEGLAVVCAGCQKRKVGEMNFWEGGRWGYINKQGEIVIAPKFDSAIPFKNGKAEVKLDGESLQINKEGKVIMGPKEINSIGSARMEKEGTIVLQLRAESAGGAVGDALLRYSPGDPRYKEILRHLGGLEIGQEKPVPPWPEKK